MRNRLQLFKEKEKDNNKSKTDPQNVYKYTMFDWLGLVTKMGGGEEMGSNVIASTSASDSVRDRS